jgi:hypothetical protein
MLDFGFWMLVEEETSAARVSEQGSGVSGSDFVPFDW